MAAKDKSFIRWLQQRLNEHGAKLKVDGIAGPKTRAALRAFQQRSGLMDNALATAETVTALQANPKQIVAPQPVQPETISERIRRMMIERGASGQMLDETMADYARVAANGAPSMPAPMGAVIGTGQAGLGLGGGAAGMINVMPRSSPSDRISQARQEYGMEGFADDMRARSAANQESAAAEEARMRDYMAARAQNEAKTGSMLGFPGPQQWSPPSQPQPDFDMANPQPQIPDALQGGLDEAAKRERMRMLILRALLGARVPAAQGQ